MNANLQRSTALRAAKDNPSGGAKLVRRGQELCLATNVHRAKDETVNAMIHTHKARSAGQARDIEERFYTWLDMVGTEIGAVGTLSIVGRWINRIDMLEAEFLFWLERMPERSRAYIAAFAVERCESALRVAYRRRGQRWNGVP